MVPMRLARQVPAVVALSTPAPQVDHHAIGATIDSASQSALDRTPPNSSASTRARRSRARRRRSSSASPRQPSPVPASMRSPPSNERTAAGAACRRAVDVSSFCVAPCTIALPGGRALARVAKSPRTGGRHLDPSCAIRRVRGGSLACYRQPSQRQPPRPRAQRRRRRRVHLGVDAAADRVGLARGP